ncbi:MAG: Na-translocating system protein MpsC family protein [Clostridium sp.]|nr:Na-translocating system protein MpsC family protein [Clostridium sp.]
MSSLKKIKLLYVEDDEDTRAALAQFLKRLGIKVFMAKDGQEGIEVFKQVSPDIIIGDLILPTLSGVDMLKQIRAMDQEVKIIVTSTVNMIDIILNVVDLKIDHYILKPIDMEVLENRLNCLADEVVKKKEEGLSKLQLETLSNKRVLEDRIRKEFFNLLKCYQGRGARDIVVSVNGGNLEVSVFDGITAMEKTLLSQSGYTGFVEQFRYSFYRCIEKQFSDTIADITGMNGELSQIDINFKRKTDKLVFLLL